jgi:cytochrome c5
MAKKEEGYSGSAIGQLLIAIPGAIIGFTLLIALFAYLLGSGAKTEAPAVVEAAAAKVADNIKPVAEVEVAKEAAVHVEKNGEEVVKAVCSMCHAAGLMGSPKIGDASQWGPRIAQGYETLVKHAKEGIRSMPARGGNADLTDNEVAAAVAYMANQAGAKFDPATLKK